MSIDRVSMMLLQKRVLCVDDVGDAFYISTKPNVFSTLVRWGRWGTYWIAGFFLEDSDFSDGFG